MNVAGFIKALRAVGVSEAQILDAISTMQDEHLAKERARVAKYRNEKRNGTRTPRNTRTKEIPPLDPPKETPSSPFHSDDGAASAPLDARTLLFRDGLRTLADLSGRPETKLRSLLGKWLKACDDDALRVLNVILKAQQDRPASPVEWIEKHFHSKPNGSGHVKQSGSQQAIEELDRRAAERAAQRKAAGAGDFFPGTTIDASYTRRR